MMYRSYRCIQISELPFLSAEVALVLEANDPGNPY